MTATETKTYNPIGFISNVFPVFSTEGISDSEVDSMISSIHDAGYQTFYLFANEKFAVKVQTPGKNSGTLTTQQDSVRPRLLKCTKNIVGSSVTVVDGNSADFNLGAVKTQAYYNLPKMSSQFVKNVDTFFRHVHKEHGTEAIVIFTYDSTYKNSDNPSDGWGIAVPKQENTAASCDYDQQSVLDAFPDDYDHIYQVGTAHSHPMMDAYCSGTDKADQASFDGIHITFGWKGPVTEYHIELQMGDSAFTLRTDQVFDMEPVEIPDQVRNWSKNVTKKTYPAAASAYGQYGMGSYASTGSSTGGYMNQSQVDKNARNNLPSVVPLGTEETLIYRTIASRNDIKTCPVCESHHYKPGSTRCYKCMTFILEIDETIEDLINLRKSNFPASSHELDVSLNPHKEIWLCEEDYDEQGLAIFSSTMIHPGRGGKPDETVYVDARTTGTDEEWLTKPSNETKSTLPDDEPTFTHVVCTYCGEENDTHAWQCIKCEGFEFAPPGIAPSSLGKNKQGNFPKG